MLRKCLFQPYWRQLIGIFLLALSVSPILAGDQSNLRWVHGSWVNVRTSADSNSPVVTQLTANTKVSVRVQTDKACEVTWGNAQRGFVPCRFLGDKPLTLAETASAFQAGSNKENPQYSPPRAFWIAPSMAALFSAGRHFQATMLPSKQQNLESGQLEDGQCCINSEQNPPKLVRYPVPEFEAMKAVLVKGIVASPDLDPPLLNCLQMQQARDKQLAVYNGTWSEWDYPNRENFPHAYPAVHDCRVQSLPSLSLPTIRPSFFKNAKEILPGNAGIERISAHFGLVERGRVTGTPKWELDYDSMRYTGAWDIGRYELTLERPVIEHVIGRTGLVGAYRRVPQLTLTPNGPSERCDEGLSNKRLGKELLAGYPAIKDALLWFQSPAALPLRKAKIRSRSERGQSTQSTLDNESRGIKRVAIFEIDLDDDGVADFVQWDLWGSPQISGPDPLLTLRIVFVNINGDWYPFDRDSYGECT